MNTFFLSMGVLVPMGVLVTLGMLVPTIRADLSELTL